MCLTGSGDNDEAHRDAVQISVEDPLALLLMRRAPPLLALALLLD